MILGLVLALMLSGCVQQETPQKQLTAEEITAKSRGVMKNVDSYASDIETEVNTSVSLSRINGSSKVDLKNKRSYLKTTTDTSFVPMRGIQMKMESYIIGNTSYTKVYGNWRKTEIQGLWAEPTNTMTMATIEGIEFSLIGSEIIRGVDCYIVESKPNPGEVIGTLIQTTEGTNISADYRSLLINSTKNIEFRQWISKSDFTVRKIYLLHETEDRGTHSSAKTIIEIYDINQPMDIELPEEAKNQ